MLQNMVSLGFFQFLFPFLLALAIFYSIINFAAGERIPKSANGLISLILGFFVMLFASANPQIVGFFQSISGTGLIVGTGILFLVILLGILGFKTEDMFGDKDQNKKWIFVLVVVVAGFIIFFGAGAGAFLPGITIGQDWFTIIFFVVMLAIVLWFLGRDGNNGNAKSAPQAPRGR